MGVHQEELERKVKRIQLFSRKTVMEILAGEYRSAFRGAGIDFEDIREYQFGDDVRNIDWNVTARTDAPHVKVFMEERELCVYFLLDVSGSMAFGGEGSGKRDAVANALALLAFSATHNNDKVGMVLFSDSIEFYARPGKTTNHVSAMVSAALGFEPKSRDTDISAALEFITKVKRSPAVVFLFSDFHSEGFDKRLRETALRHDLICVEINDPRELETPDAGMLELVDAETGRAAAVDCRSGKARDALRREAERRHHRLSELCMRSGADLLRISTEDDCLQKIVSFLRARKERGANAKA